MWRALALSWASLPERLRAGKTDTLIDLDLAPRSSPVWATAETPPEALLRWSRPLFWALLARFSEPAGIKKPQTPGQERE